MFVWVLLLFFLLLLFGNEQYVYWNDPSWWTHLDISCFGCSDKISIKQKPKQARLKRTPFNRTRLDYTIYKFSMKLSFSIIFTYTKIENYFAYIR